MSGNSMITYLEMEDRSLKILYCLHYFYVSTETKQKKVILVAFHINV